MEIKDVYMRNVFVVFLISLSFIYSCKYHKQDDGRYYLVSDECYSKKIFVPNNKIVCYNNFDVYDSTSTEKMWINDTIFCNNKISKHKDLGINYQRSIIPYKERVGTGRFCKKSRSYILDLDSTRVVKEDVRSLIIDIYIKMRYRIYKRDDTFDGYKSFMVWYFSKALVYSVGQIDYSDDFKTYVIAILNPDPIYSSAGHYDDKYLLLINVRDGMVLSIVEISRSSFEMEDWSSIKGNMFKFTSDWYYGDVILSFETRKELIRAKRSSPPKEAMISEFYFDENGYLKFTNNGKD